MDKSSVTLSVTCGMLGGNLGTMGSNFLETPGISRYVNLYSTPHLDNFYAFFLRFSVQLSAEGFRIKHFPGLNNI